MKPKGRFKLTKILSKITFIFTNIVPTYINFHIHKRAIILLLEVSFTLLIGHEDP